MPGHARLARASQAKFFWCSSSTFWISWPRVVFNAILSISASSRDGYGYMDGYPTCLDFSTKWSLSSALPPHTGAVWILHWLLPPQGAAQKTCKYTDLGSLCSECWEYSHVFYGSIEVSSPIDGELGHDWIGGKWNLYCLFTYTFTGELESVRMVLRPCRWLISQLDMLEHVTSVWRLTYHCLCSLSAIS